MLCAPTKQQWFSRCCTLLVLLLLQDRAATASPDSPIDLSKEPSEGSMPSTPGMAAAAQGACACQATEELLAAGHVIVANAGLSQMDSGVRGGSHNPD